MADQVIDTRAYILGTQLSLLNQEQLLTCLDRDIQRAEKRLVLSGNIHSFNLAYDNPWLQDFFNQADYVRLDGAGLSLGAKISGYSPPARMTWADFGWCLAAMAEKRGYTMFLLGGDRGIADKAAAKLVAAHPNLQIAGTHHGYFDKTPGSTENEWILAQINAAIPNILIVGFGMPLQEKWLAENWNKIDANVALTGGAVFDYISGELQRGPRWLTDNGFEWLARLHVEPRRLWRRYVIGNPLFFLRIMKQRFN